MEENMEIDKKTIKALSADSRLSILKNLGKRRMMPSELSKKLGLSPSTVVEHLKLLEESDLVNKVETGHKWIYYQITDKGLGMIEPKRAVSFILVLALGVVVVFGGMYGYYMESTMMFSGVSKALEQDAMTAPVAGSGTAGEVGTAAGTNDETRVTEPPRTEFLSIGIIILGILLIITSVIIRHRKKK
ncbi:MAG: winged helix-turn-helix domain-containing protein [Candidatus Aenigmatarchaeota archaeon]